MNTNAHEDQLLHGTLVFQVVGCAMEVLNALGHGLLEKLTLLRVGLIINFNIPKLEWKRIIP